MKSMSIENPKFNKAEKPILEEVNLKDLKKGDKIVIEVGNKTIYEITLLGREKGNANVRLKISKYSTDNPKQPQIKELTARMPGGFEMDKVEDIGNDRVVTKEGIGIMKDTIKTGGEHTLYFENIKDLDGKPYAKQIRTAPVSKILEVDKQEKND